MTSPSVLSLLVCPKRSHVGSGLPLGVPDLGAAVGVRRFLRGHGARWVVVAWLALGLAACLAPAASLAQSTGVLQGQILEAATGEALPGASVRIDTLTIGAAADVDGRYRVTGIPPGTYRVTVSFIGFQSKTITGVTIDAGTATSLDVSLQSGVAELDELVVTADEERGSTADVLNERKTAASVVDVLDAQQISVAGGDAAAAIEQVSGAEVTEGKFVKVRGFGGRYGKVTINGVPVPAISPDENAVPLDIISSDVLQSASVTKGWTPDLPADFVGGLVDLRTVETPASLRLSVSSETSVNTATSFQDGLTIGGCDDTWTGFSTCYRWPSSVANLPDTVGITGETLYSGFRTSSHFTALDSAAVFAAGGDVLRMMPVGPSEQTLPFGQSYEISGGNRLSVGGRPLGILGVASYSNAFQQFEDYVFNSPTLDPIFDEVQQTTQTVRVGGLVGLSYEPTDTQRLSSTWVYNRLTDDLARSQTGLSDVGGENLQTRTATNQRVVSRLISGQLAGDHALAPRISLDWTAAYTQTRRLEPGTMPVRYQGPAFAGEGNPRDTFASPDSVVFTAFAGNKDQSSVRSHFDQRDNAYVGKFDLTARGRVSGRRVAVKTGGFSNLNRRIQDGHRVEFVAVGNPTRDLFGFFLPDRVYTADNLAGDFDGVTFPDVDNPSSPAFRRPGIYLDEATQEADNFEADLNTWATYAMLDAEPIAGLRLVGGVRLVRTYQRVDINPKRNGGAQRSQDLEIEQTFTDWLPGLSLKYAINETMDVRLSYGQTIGRPQFRELVPVLYQPRLGAPAIAGNPNLDRTLVDNIDLRYSWYPTATALVSIGAFYKLFDGPIEPLAGADSRFVNTGAADTYGAEMEVRIPLGLVDPRLAAFAVRTNLTVLRTEADQFTFFELTDTGDGVQTQFIPAEGRALFGQTPILLNMGVTAEPEGWGTSLTTLFRHTGEQLRFLNGSLRTFREPLTTLDVIARQSLPGGLSLSLEVRNLIGQEIRYTTEVGRRETRASPDSRVLENVLVVDNRTQEAYNRGRTIDLGFTWRLP